MTDLGTGMAEVKARLESGLALLNELLEQVRQGEPPPIIEPADTLVGLQSPASFYDHVRGDAGELWPTMTPNQHEGCETLLKACAGKMPMSWTAYALATAYHETAYTMQPVREAFWLSEDWRRQNLRYFPWYGRGYVQLTWERNYIKADDELGLGGRLKSNPDVAMEPEIAADIMVRGMIEGWFTGKSLRTYIAADATLEQFVNARRIINGTDKAEKIAGYAMTFYRALKAGEWR
jgi:putative chitinase